MATRNTGTNQKTPVGIRTLHLHERASNLLHAAPTPYEWAGTAWSSGVRDKFKALGQGQGETTEATMPCEYARLPRREGLATSTAVQHCDRFHACHLRIGLCRAGECGASTWNRPRHANGHQTPHSNADCNDKPEPCKRRAPKPQQRLNTKTDLNRRQTEDLRHHEDSQMTATLDNHAQSIDFDTKPTAANLTTNHGNR